MKKALNVLALLTLVSVGVIAARSYSNPSDAALAAPAISNYLRQGFSIDEVVPNSFRYIMAPTGNYAWGTVTVNLHGRTGGAYSLETTYATVTCTIQADDTRGAVKYNCTGSDVSETIVY